MPSIPAGTKFHGVAPDVETENRGSDLANAQRDVYTIEEINAGGGGGTTGEILSLNLLTAPYASPGDHEGTVLSIGSLGLVVGTVYMWDSSEQWGTANAGAVGTASGLMGIATATDTAPDVLVSGIIQVAAAPGAAGDVLYLEITNGTLTNAAPNGSGEIVRVMGHNLGGNRIYFNPSSDWIVLV